MTKQTAATTEQTTKTETQTTETKKEQKNKFDPYAPHKIKWWGWPLLILLIVGTVYIIRTNRPAADKTNVVGQEWKTSDTQRNEGEVFGTFYHITYQYQQDMQKGIDAALKQVDHSLSPFNKESVITAINNNASMETDSMFVEVFTLAQKVSAETNGAFDITVAPLVNLWGFGFKNMAEVNQAKVDSLLPFVGYQTVKLVDGKIVKEHPETMLDCSAIAKGYGVDAVGKYLEGLGIKNYMVEIGGEVRVRGTNPRGELWRIGINKPDDDPASISNEIEQVLQVTQLSMATSGNYRNYYEKDGKKYAHTIDPRTGYPVQHSILSSTVLAQDCATADAFATAFMVLGLDEAKKVLAKHPELMVFFIYTDADGGMQEWHTESLQNLMVQ
ncbi:MAG: FAD:protein FMN transferase [Bacteroidaceae bacterium]|nr:FAD:protein FMN transferase [Bacteroidaceae bacterium]